MRRKGSAPRHATRVALPEVYTSGLQPSMSRSEILIECSFPFGKQVEEEASEPARYGSAFHDLQADMIGRYILGWKTRLLAPVVAKKWGFDEKVAEELVPHVRSAYDVLKRWLEGTNPYKIPFLHHPKTILIEEAVALKPCIHGRKIEGHDSDHRYHGLHSGEIPGTLDMSIVPTKRKLPVLVIDHKTGEEDFSRPETKHQLMSLGAAVMRWTGADEAILAVLHARRRGLPKIYSEKVSLSDLHDYEVKLSKQIERIGDGSMKPGPWCKYCPAQEVCPARDGQLLDTAGDMLTSLTAASGALSLKGLTANDVVVQRAGTGMTYERKLGLLYTIKRKAQIMAGRAGDEIKKAILENPGLMPITPEDEYLIVREFEKEELSKKGIIEAYGKVAGEKMLNKLRKDGAIKKNMIKQLWPAKER